MTTGTMSRTADPVLEVTDARCTAPNGTTLLDGVSFVVEPGWLVAVVGPTGAGKTSLAKVLLGQRSLTGGTVRVSGREAFARSGRVAGVPQDDATHPQLSLRRTLDHAVALRADVSPSQRRHRIDTVLAELGLTSRAGTRLADLSGGERKRANVAVELMGSPDLLVLDEPTAGLDPGFEKSVFANLRTLADSGRTIVTITHSIRVLEVCDRVLFLAPGGVMAFFGTPAEAQAYFAWDEPADAFAALATEPPSSWKARFAARSTATRPPVEQVPTATSPSPMPYAWSRATSAPSPAWSRPTPPPDDGHRGRSGHLRTMLHRALHLASSDHRTLALSLVAGPVLGVLLWAVLPGGTLRPPSASDGALMASAPKAITFAFFLAMTITWLGAAGAAREVVKERHILRRELGAGVSLTTYLTGKALFLSALTAVQALPLAGIALLHQGAPSGGPALGSALAEVLVVAVLVGVAAVATGLLVSCWASSSEKAMTALPIVLVAQLALAGPWAGHRGITLELLRDLVPAKWASAAVAATVLGDASGWWLAVGCLCGLIVVQLGAALVLLQHQAPSRTAEHDRLGAVGARLATTRPPGIRFVPVALAVLLALAAGVGAMGRSGGAPSKPTAVALPAPAPAPAPRPALVTPAPSPAPPAPATPATTAARPAPPPTPVVTPTPPAPVALPVAPRTATPATTTPPTTRPATTPTTARPATPTTAPPAATAATNPLLFTNLILQQIFQPPPPRR